MSTIQPHNERASTVWSSPGELYDDVSITLHEPITHVLDRLRVQPNEKVLDVATGTGLAARLLARRKPGVKIVASDISPGLLEAGRTLSRKEGVDGNISFELADADKLPYADGSFDVVTSTFGVMFSTRPELAAAELARVTKQGGRIGLTTWKPDGEIFELFKILKNYMPPPPNPPPPSSFAWGGTARVTELLGNAFDLEFEDGSADFRLKDAEESWTFYSTKYGPSKMIAAGLPEDRREQLHRDLVAYHSKFQTPLGIKIPRTYLVTVGVRK